MAIINKTVQIRGDAVQITSVMLVPQKDNSCVILVSGVTLDSDGRPVALKDAQLNSSPGQNPVINDFLSIGVAALRRLNGLDDGAPATEDLTPVAAGMPATTLTPVQVDAQPDPVSVQPTPLVGPAPVVAG